MSERLSLTPIEAVTIRSGTPEALEVEAGAGTACPRRWPSASW
jgi:hypothetical protein